MKKILLPAIGVVAALISVAQSAAEISKSNSEGIYQSLEQIQNEETDLNKFDLFQANDHVSYLNELSAREVSSSPKVLSLDSIVVESYDAALENWMRMGKYKFYTVESDSRKESFHAIWDYTAGEWQNFTTVRWEYDDNGRPAYYLSIPGAGTVDGVDSRYKRESFYSYSDETKEVESIDYWRNSSSVDYNPTRKEKTILTNEDKILLTLSSVWNNQTADWVYTNKKEYEYDDNGFSILHAEYSWSAAMNDWVGTLKKEYVNNGNGKPLSEIRYVWENDGKQWRSQWKIASEYDDLGYNTGKIISFWDVNEEKWVYNEKENSVFDSAGNLMSRIHFQWDSEKNSWTNGIKYEYGYVDPGNQRLASTYLWSEDENKWIGYSQTETLFDLLNNLSFKTEYKWDSIADSWIYYSMEKPDYNEHGHITLTAFYEWDNEQEEWKYIHDMNAWEYEYNARDKITRKILSQWNSYEQRMDTTVKNEYEYDGQDRQIMMQNSSWNHEMNIWVPHTRKINDFDEAGNYILDLDNVWDNTLNDWRIQREYKWEFDSNNRIILSSNLQWYGYGDLYSGSKSENLYNDSGRTLMNASYYWDVNTNNWAGSTKKEFTYYDQTLLRQETVSKWNAAEKDWKYYNRQTWYYTFDTVMEVDGTVSEIEMKVYPNPADAQIKIQLPNPVVSARLELFSIGGQKMLSEIITDGEQITIQHLTPGIYLYRLIQDQKHYTGKIIKK